MEQQNPEAMRTDTNGGNKERILIKANYQLVPVNLDEILFIKALSDYVIIKTTTGKYITLCTMKDMVSNLPNNVFVRSHRSFIVNLDKVSAVKGSTIEIRDKDMRFSVPIGRAYKKDFKASLNAA
jgi:DNA-binding LytR/AlgR family response regulator